MDQYNAMAIDSQKAEKAFLYPCLYDSMSVTVIEPTYFFQDSWAFEKIYQKKPKKHVDIGSHHKFVAFLSKVVDLTMVDIRPLSIKLDSINFQQGDILHLPFKSESIESLSSLCVIEHIGLGRYGDDLDPMGSEKAIKEITRVLKLGAHFYLSVPVSDRNVVAFNAGRIFSLEYLFDLLNDYTTNEQKFINGSCLQDKFIPNDEFGCTILLDLIKK